MKTHKELMDEFYSQDLYLSYSAINKLLFSPRLYHQYYILKQKEEKVEAHMLEGKITHCLLLEEDKFGEYFQMMPTKLPGDSIKNIVDWVYTDVYKAGKCSLPFPTLAAFETEIVQYLKDINLYQTLKTDQQRIEKVITLDATSYFEFLKIKEGKELVDSDTYNKCKEAAEAIKNHREAADLMGIYATEMYSGTILNEFPLTASLSKYPFNIKGVIDNLNISHEDKTIYINDVKKISRTLTDFPESVENYNYWLQAAIYKELIMNNYMTLVANGYKIVINFIVVDRYNSVYCFPVSEKSMIEWNTKMHQVLEQAEWHYKNRNYDLPYALAANKLLL